jgi:prepilin-type processing-associated H-X9-DG protein
VVIAIIAILAAILFPVFAKARQRAQNATCQSNLRQLGQAALMYQDDNGYMIMPALLVPFTDFANWEISSWYQRVNPYMRVLNQTSGFSIDERLTCPLAPKVDPSLRRTYGYNLFYASTAPTSGYPTLRHRSPGAMSNPSSTIQFMEVWQFKEGNGASGVPTAAGRGSLFCYPPQAYPYAGDVSNGGYAYAPGFHSGRVATIIERLRGQSNIVWFDGHVSSMVGRKIYYNTGTTVTDAWFRDKKLPADGV